MGNYQSDEHDYDEISLKEFILIVRDYFLEAIRFWWLILICMLIFVSAYVLHNKLSQPEYEGKLTFMVNEEESQDARMGEIGLNLANIIEFSKSRKILEQVFFDTGEVNGKNDYFANHIISIYELDDKLSGKYPGLTDFRFTHSNKSHFSKEENKMFLEIYMLVVGNTDREDIPLINNFFSDETGIISLEMSSTQEELTIGFLKNLYDKLNNFYEEKSIDKYEKIYTISKLEADTILAALNTVKYSVAEFTALNPGMSATTTPIRELSLVRKLEVLTILYADAQKEVQSAKFNLDNKVPFSQLIDEPIGPIEASNKMKLKRMLMMGILGAFLAIAYVCGRKLIKSVLN